MLFAVHEKEPNVFYVNENGRLQNRSAQSGADFSGNSRSAAYLDFDNDGDLDVIINNFDAKATFLVNNSEKLHNNWMKVKLIGNPAKHSNRDAIGATIVATTPSGNRIWREVQSATGYLSQHPTQQLSASAKTSSPTSPWSGPTANGDVQRAGGESTHTITQRMIGLLLVTALRFGSLIDGQGSVVKDAVVVVDGERIVSVGGTRRPARREVIDLRKYTAIPGLIDAHTHMTYNWDRNAGTGHGAAGTLHEPDRRSSRRRTRARRSRQASRRCAISARRITPTSRCAI